MTRRLLAAVLASALLLVTACGPGKGETVNEHLTVEAARERSQYYLVETLRTLPQGASLASYLPGSLPQNAFDHGGITPCDDDDTKTNIPVNFYVSYWILGLTSGSSESAVNSVLDAWKRNGWPVDKNDTVASSSYSTRTDDGYGMRISRKKDDAVSLTVSSVCFPPPSSGTKIDTLPATIEHP